MSLDSKQEALDKLFGGDGNTCGWNNPLFESGHGVAWERLIKDVENLAEADQPALKAEKAWVAAEEALAEAIQKHSAVGSDHVDHTNARVEACRLALRRAKQRAEKLGKSPTRPKPWTSAEAAGLLNLSQKVFREFAKGSSPTGPLLPDDRTHAAIGIARLLEWADAHPRLRRWRESRETGKPLGQRVPMPPQTRFKVVQEVQVDFSLIEGKGFESLVNLLKTRNHSSFYRQVVAHELVKTPLVASLEFPFHRIPVIFIEALLAGRGKIHQDKVPD